MIPYLRQPSYQMNRQAVTLLVEIRRNEASMLALDNPIATIPLSTTQAALIAEMDVPGDRWSDREALIVGQRLLDDQEDWGGLGLVLTVPPPEPEPEPVEEPAPEAPPA